MSWKHGQVVVRREILKAGPWLGGMVYVVEDTAEGLVSYLPEGTPFGFPEGDWPYEGGRHPWEANGGKWTGHGVLMVQAPGDPYAVWHFWNGPEREFTGWYLNLQEPFRRTPVGYDTSDLELDLWVFPDGRWVFKDLELLPERVAQGRWTQEESDAIRACGERLGARLDRGERWWDERWAAWSPDADWAPQPLPDGWDALPFERPSLLEVLR